MLKHLMLTVLLGTTLVATGSSVPSAVVVGAPARVAQVAPEPAAVVQPAVAASATPADTSVQQMDVVVDPDATTAGSASASASPTPAPSAAVTPDAGTLVAGTPAGPDRVVTPAVQVSAVQTVAVTWPHGTDGSSLTPQVRTQENGTWSAWQDMATDDDAPDAGSPDAVNARSGTEATYVGDVDAVQLSFAATAAPDGTKVALIGSTASVTPSGAAAPAVAVGHAASQTVEATAIRTASSAGLTVIPRSAWGAANAVCTADVASTLVGAVVHHTADSNAYTTQAQAMQMIRNDQAYHINTRGWCDIGYNFIVDKWGNIYEGREGSLTKPVIGVHDGGFNTGTVGVSMLGNYDLVQPSDAMVQAVGRLIGYRFAAYGLDPNGTMRYSTGAGENSRYINTTVTLPRIFGHRDTAYTICPGQYGYAALPTIRAVAATMASAQDVADADVTVRALYQDMLGRDVDSAGLTTWMAVSLANGGAGVVASSLAHSPEYVTTQVSAAYRAILGRDPDSAGLATWVAEITSGRLRSEDLHGALIASDEYYSRAGGTPAKYVTALYRDVLGRTPSAADLEFWSQVATRSGRPAVPAGIWFSMENATLQVSTVYQTFLARGADPAGLATWPTYWLAHGDDALRAGIVDSVEYLARAHTRFDTAANA